MANIQEYLRKIKSAIYGRDVRDSIHDAIDAINTEVEEAYEEIDEFVQGEMDTTLTSTELPAQGKAVGDAIEDVVIASDTQPTSEFNQIWIDEDGETEYQVPTYSEFSEVKNALSAMDTATASDAGKALKAKTVSGGKVTEWEFGEAGSVDPADIAEAVDDWLDAHPEATTTVEDGSITYDKLSDNVLNYVTPEEFGAKGDGSTDDTQAIQDCLDHARTNRISVRGYNRYKTTSAIVISGVYMDVFFNTISYTGDEYGIVVRGSYHEIRIMQLYCSNGGAVVYKADSSNVSYNKFHAMRVFANNHAVDLQATNDRWILYNTFDIRVIKSGTGNCYNGTSRCGENVFENSTCTCENGWAIYSCRGKFYNFTLEGDVLNGIYDASDSYYSGFRVRELVDKLVRRIAGFEPAPTGGTLIKYVGKTTRSRFICDDFIPYEAIDVSEMDTIEDIMEHSSTPYADVSKLAHYGIIDAPIRYGQWETKNGRFIIGKQMIITGGRKICIPAFETVYTIADADFDMRDEQVALNNAKPYPTKMIIDVDNCVIHLPTSYCAYGYSKLIVDQTNHTCTIYDSNSSVTPIFNGASLGHGVYRLVARCDSLNNAITLNRQEYATNLNDSTNYVWEITRIGDTTGVVSVDDYGAIGDGVTDDSQAIQEAINNNYDVYFESNKTYYVPTPITIDHDIHLHGGKNTVLKTSTVSGSLNDIFVCNGTLKKTTTLTTDYTRNGNTDNSGNRFTLADMDGINAGDIMVIKATDQYYSYVRQYYHLGMSLLIGEKYDNHLYATESIPYDITLTQNLSVRVYSAPTVIIEDMDFVGDRESIGSYKYFIVFNACKNSTIRNCKLHEMDSGIQINHCVNTLVDNIFMSDGKNDNTISGDGYGIKVDASTNTIIQRINSIVAQTPITTGGDVTTVNLYVRNCDLTAQCRHHGIGMHENSFNIVVEDCTLGGLNVLGTGIVNRCRFIKNNRINADGGITFCGNHDPKRAILKVSNCTFEPGNNIYIYAPTPQNPIQATDNIIGLVEVTDCDGGFITFDGTVSQYMLSNVIKEMRLIRWTNCKEFYRPNPSTDVIEKMTVCDCSFQRTFWVNDHNESHGVILTNILDLDYRSSIPMQHKISVDKDVYAERYTLPENTPIELSSNNSSAKFIVCGRNLASNDPNDYEIGSVSGSDGGTLTRAKAAGNIPTITNDVNGNIVFTQLNNSSSYCFYPVGMFYIREPGNVTLSATLKNTGNTSGARFSPYIAFVDCDTGKLISRYTTTDVEATASGANVTFSHGVKKANVIAMAYFYCKVPVALSETTFENISVTLNNDFAPSSKESIPPYIAKTRTGDGSIMSFAGVNNIMCSDLNFHVKILADYIENPIGTIPSASG